MTRLSSILIAILRDLAVAQNEANLYAVSLEEVYLKNGCLERFPLPAIALGEVELELRYAVNGESGAAERQQIPSMEVTVNADALSKLPAGCLHTLHLRISPRNIRRYADEEI